MLHWINASEWFYTSKTISKRQHHVGGFLNNLRMVFRHFPMPSQCLREISSPKELACYSALKNSSDFMDRFVYFSQVYQALVLKRQTEHYRRFRKILLPDGRGNTQCAMYWQLNDVWAAPSWSSIDFDLQWKIAHYEARKFMASTAAVLYSPSDRVQITIVNDLPIALNRSTVILEQIPWSNKFEPIYQWSTVLDVPAATAIEVDMSSANQNQLRLQPASGYLLRVRVLSPNKTELLPETVLFPDKLYEIDFNDFGDPRIESVKKVNDTTYSISLISQSISPFTWITIRRSVLGWFSDNGFTMTSERKIVTLHLRNATDLTIEDFAVCNLKTCAAL